MWATIWKQVRHDVRNVDIAHPENERYKRAAHNLSRIVAIGEVIAYRDFSTENVDGKTMDVCFLVVWVNGEWWSEADRDYGTYSVFKVYYSHRQSDQSKVGKREYKVAYLISYYDGLNDDSPKMKTKAEALQVVKRKGGYHEIG